MAETWKPVVGREGRYEVSDMGRVRSFFRPTGAGMRRRAEPLVLAPRPLRTGHLRVAFGRGVEEQIHRVVLTAFRGPAPEGFDASHLNGDPADNRLENLVWESRAANLARKAEHGTQTFGESHPTATLSNADVAEIRRLCAAGSMQTEVAEQFAVNPSTISRIVAGRRRSRG